MEFNINKVYTAVDAEGVKVGSKGYFADTYAELKFLVHNNSSKIREITKIQADDYIKRFCTKNEFLYPYCLFYLLEEPKETEEKYRPYNSIDEFLDDYCAKFTKIHPIIGYPIIWVQDVNNDIARMITEYGTIDNTVRIGDYWCSMEELLEDYVYLDGSRCGIKEE